MYNTVNYLLAVVVFSYIAHLSCVYAVIWVCIYCILEIAQGGKVSQLQNQIAIFWKTFVVPWLHGIVSHGHSNYFTGKLPAVGSQLVKTVKLFHLEQFAIYGSYFVLTFYKIICSRRTMVTFNKKLLLIIGTFLNFLMIK